MRPFLFFALLFLLLLTSKSQDQYSLGIKIGPVLNTHRTKNQNDDYEVKSASYHFGLSGGLIFDWKLSETYFLSTGLIYIPKRVLLSMNAKNSTQPFNYTSGNPDQYKLQYLQIPLTAKLKTNEVLQNLKIYLQLGLALDIKVYEEALNLDKALIASFTPLSVPLVAGAGVEYQLGVKTVLFGGLVYHRGLNEIMKKSNLNDLAKLEIRNALISLEVGLRL